MHKFHPEPQPNENRTMYSQRSPECALLLFPFLIIKYKWFRGHHIYCGHYETEKVRFFFFFSCSSKIKFFVIYIFIKGFLPEVSDRTGKSNLLDRTNPLYP
jgi:hypothetical protein